MADAILELNWADGIAGDARPTVLLCGNGATGDFLTSLADALGQRILGRVAIDDLALRLAQTIALDTLVLDLRGSAPDRDVKSAAIRANRERHQLPSCRLVVLFDAEAIDWVFAELDGPDAILLCDPGLPDIVTALAMSRLDAGDCCNRSVSDVVGETDPSRIEQLSEEVRRLATTIDRLVSGDARPVGFINDRKRLFRPRPIEDRVESANGTPPSHVEVRALIRARRLRDRFLPEALFADPAWDMMLDLFAARLADKRVSVSSLCIAAAVPPTTALRWIRQLTDRGIFQRIDDPVDGRRVFIELSEEAAHGVLGWARAVRGNGGLLPADQA